jgi:nucleoid-associated protein YgaU
MKLLGKLEAGAAPASFDELLVRAAGAALVLALGWLAVVIAAVAIEAVTDGRWRPARFTGAPERLRRVLLAAVLGVLAVLGTTTAATATRSGTTGPSATAALEGLPLPDRPVGTLVVAAPGQRWVTVRPEDSLWRIAQRLLPGADDARLATAVVSLHHANRDLLGSDPDLVHPGERLRVPATSDLEERA